MTKHNDPRVQAGLAIDGGSPSFPESALPQPGPRWGNPELELLREALGNRSLFYHKHSMTSRMLERFQAQYPLEHVMPCSSGTAAIHIALAAARLEPGDEVITAPVTDMGTAIGILYQQAVPVFADLDPRTYNLDPADVERRITPRTRAILAVHLAGNPCDMEALMDICERHQLLMIEDCAQAWGAAWRGQPVGTIGHFGCYSLNDFKHIGCGDGGVVGTNDARFGARLQPYGDKGYDRTHGRSTPEILAPCYRISALQAAVAAAQFERLPEIAARRNRLGGALVAALAEVPGILVPEIDSRDFCTYWFAMFRLDLERFSCSRDQFIAAVNAEGLPASAGYIPMPLYRYPVFQSGGFFGGRWNLRESGLTAMDYRTVECPQAEAILHTAFRLTVHECMTGESMRLAAETVGKVARHYLR